MKRILVLVGLLAGCSPGAIAPQEVEGPFTWSNLDGVTRIHHHWFAGQPDAAALAAAREAGVEIVVNLRPPDEFDWDERAAAEELGLGYYNVPIPREGPFPPEAIEKLDALVAEHHGAEMLLHCSSGNRAAGWFATHLVRTHGMPLDDALAVGRKAGITSPGIEDKVRAFTAGADGGS